MRVVSGTYAAVNSQHSVSCDFSCLSAFSRRRGRDNKPKFVQRRLQQAPKEEQNLLAPQRTKQAREERQPALFALSSSSRNDSLIVFLVACPSWHLLSPVSAPQLSTLWLTLIDWRLSSVTRRIQALSDKNLLSLSS